MRKIKVQIEGIAPILFNRFMEECLEQSGKKKSKASYVDDAAQKVYRDDKTGEIGIPAENLKKCLLEGCKFAGIKIGRRSAEPFMRATVFVETPFVSFGAKEPDGIHSCSGRVPPKTGSRVMIHRPFLDTGWKAKFVLCVHDERVTTKIIKDSLGEAGVMAGLCDHRPDFGRFMIKSFKETK